MVNVWRIHLRKGGVKDSVSIGDYCIKNNIAAMGWILKKNNEKIKSGEIIITSYADYEKYVGYEDYKEHHCVKTLALKIKPGDYIWTYLKADKTYYLAKVGSNSKYNYNASDEAIENDACNELTNIEWKAIGDHNSVDEKIVDSFKINRTLQRVYNPNTNWTKYSAALKYTQKVYEEQNE